MHGRSLEALLALPLLLAAAALEQATRTSDQMRVDFKIGQKRAVANHR